MGYIAPAVDIGLHIFILFMLAILIGSHGVIIWMMRRDEKVRREQKLKLEMTLRIIEGAIISMQNIRKDTKAMSESVPLTTAKQVGEIMAPVPQQTAAKVHEAIQRVLPEDSRIVRYSDEEKT